MNHVCSKNVRLAGVLAVALFGFASQSLAQGGVPLLTDPQLPAWTTEKGEPVTKGWKLEDGVLHLDPKTERGGHIVTAQEYGDFVLDFEWKISPRGNSGIKYRVRDYDGRLLGCEYQIFDDQGHGTPSDAKGSTASLYDVYGPAASKVLHPAGEWNHGRIVVRGQCIEHWLNGQLVVQAVVGSPEWQQRIADSKFASKDHFGENRYGKIMLTDHGSEVWYRNIVVTPLEVQPTQYVRYRSPGPLRRAALRLLGRRRCR